MVTKTGKPNIKKKKSKKKIDPFENYVFESDSKKTVWK